ncbi:MAG: hypothetical protein ABI585_11905 [Betaproteobacteria bacterium]
MPTVVRAFPLLGSLADLQAFASELKGARAGDAGRFYRHYGVESESWHLQHTPQGPWVIAVTSIVDPTEAAPRFADATEAFHLWFKSRVESLTGVDPNTMPLGPPTKELFSWSSGPVPKPKTAAVAR